MIKRTVVRMPEPTEEEWKLSPSQERERQQAALLLPHEDLVAKLWQRVMIPDSLVHIALDMSPGHWQARKASGDAPPRITINGLRYVLTSDLRAWLEHRPKTLETKNRRGKKRSANVDNETGAGAASVHDYCHTGPQVPGRDKTR